MMTLDNCHHHFVLSFRVCNTFSCDQNGIKAPESIIKKVVLLIFKSASTSVVSSAERVLLCEEGFGWLRGGKGDV